VHALAADSELLGHLADAEPVAYDSEHGKGGVEQVVTQLLAQPDEVPYVGRTGDTTEHHFDGHHPLVAPLDDEIDLVVPVSAQPGTGSSIQSWEEDGREIQLGGGPL
jgi:hypothetical protein